MPANPKPHPVPDLEPQATATAETRVPFEFRGVTYHTRAKPTVNTVRALQRRTAGQPDPNFEEALLSLVGPEETAAFYRRHGDDDGIDTLKEFFDALAEHLGGNF